MTSVARQSAMPDLPARNLERKAQIKRLHELLPSLNDEEMAAVYFRFWESLTIHEIANILGRSWNQTNELIEQALQKLREGFFEFAGQRHAVAA